MSLTRGIFVVAVLMATIASSPAHADGACDIGELCAIQDPQFGCKDYSLIRRWIDINIEISREAADAYVVEQEKAGLCARFKAGDQLRILRYIGMRRVEVQRPGESAHYIVLLK